MEVSRKQIASPPFSPAIPALGICPRREICSRAPKKSCYRGINCNMICFRGKIGNQANLSPEGNDKTHCNQGLDWWLENSQPLEYKLPGSKASFKHDSMGLLWSSGSDSELPLQEAWVDPWLGKLRFCMLYSVGKKKKNIYIYIYMYNKGGQGN